MDTVLKSRKLGSAAARRRKAQEREQAAQDVEDRRTRKLLYGYSSDEEELSDEESASFSPIVGIDSNDTSEDEQPARLSATLKSPFSSNPVFTVTREIHDLPTSGSNDQDALDEDDDSMPSTPPSPGYQLHTTILVADEVASIYTDVSGVDDEFNPPVSPGIRLDTPLQTAKPVHYLIPIARPSVVSIRHSLPPLSTGLSMKPPPLSWTRPLVPPPRSAKRLSSGSMLSGFLASEATTVKVPPSPLASPPSQFSSTTAGQSSDSASVTRPTPSRTITYPLDNGSIIRPYTSHGVEKTISSPTPPPPRPYTPDIGSAYNSQRTKHSFSDSQPITRPRNGTINSIASSNLGYDIATSPSSFRPSLDQTLADTPAPPSKLFRKKSFSGLRGRSESVGKALKSASSAVRNRGRFPVVPHTNPTSPPIPALPELKLKPTDGDILDTMSWPRPPPSPFQVSDTGSDATRTSSMSMSSGTGLRKFSSRLNIRT